MLNKRERKDLENILKQITNAEELDTYAAREFWIRQSKVALTKFLGIEQGYTHVDKSVTDQ